MFMPDFRYKRRKKVTKRPSELIQKTAQLWATDTLKVERPVIGRPRYRQGTIMPLTFTLTPPHPTPNYVTGLERISTAERGVAKCQPKGPPPTPRHPVAQTNTPATPPATPPERLGARLLYELYGQMYYTKRREKERLVDPGQLFQLSRVTMLPSLSLWAFSKVEQIRPEVLAKFLAETDTPHPPRLPAWNSKYLSTLNALGQTS